MQILEIKDEKPDKQINKLAYFLTLGINREIVEKPCRPRQIREIKKSKKKWKKRFDVKKIILSTLWKLILKSILIKIKPRRKKISKGKNKTRTSEDIIQRGKAKFVEKVTKLKRRYKRLETDQKTYIYDNP